MRFASIFFRLLLLCALIAAGYVIVAMNASYGSFRQPTFVDLPKGTTAEQMGQALADAGAIHYAWEFWLARALHRNVTLQAGEYRFTHSASVLAVYDRIARGDIFTYDLVVPEGRNMFDIAQSVEQLGLFPATQFLKAARDPALIRDLDPKAPTLEGYLYPNTYRLSRHTTPDRLCRIMTGKFREVWQTMRAGGDVHRIVTLASIVEREAKLPDERPVIASVYLRRLGIGMKLDCDPTTIYAAMLEGSYRGVIYKSDLASDNPYNTYQHTGLPPGPIANPGRASIEAVLHPAEAEYLYFVARPDGSGGHNFSADLAGQRIAVAKYRKSLAR